MNALSSAEYFRDRLAVTADAYRSIDQAKCQALFAQISRQQHLASSTLSVLRIWGLLNESKPTSDPRLHRQKIRDRWQERIQPQLSDLDQLAISVCSQYFSADQHNLGAMFRAGVPIMADRAMNPSASRLQLPMNSHDGRFRA